MPHNWKRNRCVYCIITTLLFFFIFYSNDKYYIRKTTKNIEVLTGKMYLNKTPTTMTKSYSNFKFILLWTNGNKSPFIYFGQGSKVFETKKCKFVNCYVTSDRQFLGHYSEFEVIAFNGPQLSELLGTDDIPKIRLPHQKYVYSNIEAAVNYPICSTTWDGFFNWTWTYKLNSDAVWGYIAIRNSSGNVIGPSNSIDWISEDNMETISYDIKSKLSNKTKAGAWFVSNCLTISKREQLFENLQHYLEEYNLKIDVYGECGDFQCPKNIMSRCLNELQRNYYFYLAFENAISEDYVTEKTLHALNHYTVPIVYGGGKYNRFLPPGSYLDATKITPRLLAKKIYDVIQDPESYYKFFRWRKYYSYHYRHESPETDDYCKFCTMINDETLMKKSTVYNNFSLWWSSQSICNKH